MYRLIVLLVGLIAAGPAWAVCPTTPADCPSGTANNWTVANALSVTGASTLSGGGTLTGTFTGGTFSGITLSGTIAGAHTYSGNLTFNGTSTLAGTTTLSVNNTSLQFTDAAGGHPDIRVDASSNFTLRTVQSGTGTRLNALSVSGQVASPSITMSLPTLYSGSAKVANSANTVWSGSQIGGPFTSGTAAGSPFWINTTQSGSTTAAGSNAFMGINITDSVGSGGAGFALFGLDIVHNISSSTDPRWTLHVRTNANGPQTISSGENGYGSLQTDLEVNSTAGGTALAAQGRASATNYVVNINAGANYYQSLSGDEIDLAWESTALLSASANRFKYGHSVNLQDVDSVSGNFADGGGVVEDFTYGTKVNGPNVSFGVGTNPTVGWQNFMLLRGIVSQWPLDPTNGRILGIGTQTALNTTGAAMRPHSGYIGFDLTTTEWSQGLMQWPTGRLLGNGDIHTGPISIAATATGSAIDETRQIGSLASIAAAGAGYVAGEHLYLLDGSNKPMGGVLVIDTVNGSGGITAAHFLSGYQPYATSTPTNPVSTYGGSGRNGGTLIGSASINLTWTVPTTLQLGASVNTIVGTGAALATNATNGFLQIATMAGAPTGTVGAAGKAAVVIDTTNKKLCYSTGGGTWECSAAFTP